MAHTSIGIYISSKYIDIVLLKGSRSAPVLLDFVRQELPDAKTEEPGNAGTRHSISAVMKSAMGRLKAGPRPVVCTVLPSSDTIIRYFSMPLLPKSEQAQAVRFEAKKYIPFKIDEIESAFKVVPAGKNKKFMDVFFVSVAKDVLNLYLDRFSAAGIKPYSIDIISFSLLRAILLNKKVELKGTLAILYIDNDRCNMSIHIMESGMPFINRDIRIIADDKDAFFEKIVSELRVSIDYYRRQKTGRDVIKIIICGEELFVGLDAFVADELKIITEIFVNFPKIKNADKIPPSSVIAAGAALQGLGKSDYSVNFSKFEAIIQKRQSFNIFAIEAIAAIFLIAITSVISYMPLMSVKSKLKQLEAVSGHLKETTRGLSVDELSEMKQRSIEDVGLLHLVKDKRISIAEKLSSLSRHVADTRDSLSGVWIDDFSFSQAYLSKSEGVPSDVMREISVSGSAFLPEGAGEADLIDKFFDALKSDAEFMRTLNDVELSSIEKKQIDKKSFVSFKVSAYSGDAPSRGTYKDRR
jgi:Tfp pilus assembly PilM family ATPase